MSSDAKVAEDVADDVGSDASRATAPTTCGGRRTGPQGAAQGGGAVYALGTIGALVWFLRQASGPKGYPVALLKAVVWPAYLVFKAFSALSRAV